MNVRTLRFRSLSIVAGILLAITGCGRYGFEHHELPPVDAGDTADMPSIDSGMDLGAVVDAGDMTVPDARDSGADLGMDAEIDLGPPIDLGAEDMEVDAEIPIDMDTPLFPTIQIEPTSDLLTTELGGTDTFTVLLGSMPEADVTIELSSSDVLEVDVSPSILTFTPATWDSAQTVTVTGLADGVPDGNKPFTIITAPCVSSDVAYSGMNAADVTGTNLDDAMPGIVVDPTGGLETTEAGGTATFALSLQSQPMMDVAIDLSVSDATEGSVSPATAVFTEFNWNIPQEITVTGVDDFLNDGDVAYDVVVGPASGDPDYMDLTGSNVSVVNTDDDVACFNVAPVTGLTGEDGTADTITVTLCSQPIASVTVTVSSSDTTEGTVAPAVLSFTPATWNTPRTVTVTGVNDALADGSIDYNVVFAIMATADPDYAGLAPQNVPYTNVDDDTPGISVVPSVGLTTTESGGTATFSISLNTAPTSDVTVGLSSDTLTEGTVSPSSVTFTPLSYGARTVTVTGVNDFVADGSRIYHIVTAAATSADVAYNGMNATDVTVTNTDNDTASVIVSPVSGLTTNESGTTTSFTVRLSSQPSANVTISLMSSNTAEGTISLPSLTFTSGNWSVNQTVVVTGVNDTRVDGNVAYTIVTGDAVSTDMGYSGIVVSDVSVTNVDNDVASVSVTPSFGLVTTEVGGSATFTMVLTSTPTADVSVALSSSDTTEGTVSPASVTFTSGDWNVPQTVTVTGVDDAIADGDIGYTIVTAAASSADTAYNNLGVANVSVTNTDNDIVGVTVTPTSGLVTSESGTTANFTVVLDFPPAANVSITLTTSSTTEGRVSPTVMTFTPANWNTPQTATVTGIRDGYRDGDVTYTIATSNCVSTDPAYSGRTVSDVSVTNLNVDTVGIVVTPASGLTVSENRTTARFYIYAASQITGSANLTLSTSDATEGTVVPTTVYFTSASWYAPTVVTVTGVDDNTTDGDVPFSIVTSTVSTTDGAYNGMVVDDVSLTNVDNDTGDVVVSPQSQLVVTELGKTVTFSVRLGRAPSADVTVGLSSSDVGEGTVSPSSLTFTTANWATPRTVTVTGVADGTVDGEQIFSILTAPATSTDMTFSGVDGADPAITNIDVDGQRGVSFTASDYSPGWGTLQSTLNTVSTDGRYVAFNNSSSPLIASDTNGFDDGYIRDRQTNTMTVATVGTGGTQGNGHSYITAMTPDARFVMFTSYATNFDADTNGVRDAFLRDRMTNTTTRVSLSSLGAQLAVESFAMAVSNDGRYAVFSSSDPNVVPGDTNGWQDYFLRDTLMNTTTRISVGVGGAQLPLFVNGVALSGDGRYFFYSYGSALLPTDTNWCSDVYRRDLMTGALDLVTPSPGGVGACRPGLGSIVSDVSDDGRYVVFTSDTNDFVPDDTNGYFDTFVRDITLGTYRRASVATGGVQANGETQWNAATISNDGNRVLFASRATNLVPGATNPGMKLYMHDFAMNTTTLVSTSYDGMGETTSSYANPVGCIAGDGSGVAYQTSATNVLAEVFDSDGYFTVYYRTF